ncbi:MAG: FAD-binding oxidoreductase [Acidimicrobiia bacterium]|nr:FAD-binding oxidoreductase [Acidimicrobiia bacterium]MDH5294501.1 FAD-binding oxidoreductase [Acidimicrobiia bacterium]
MEATVIGAGVSGLTTAVALQRAGWSVSIVAESPPLETTSVVAAAVWTIAEMSPVERSRAWAIRSYEVFSELAQIRESGVVPLRQRELERDDLGPSWWDDKPWVHRLSREDLPAGYSAGWEIDGFMVEPPIYLLWLQSQLEQAGGRIELRPVESLAEFDGVVVNCSGLGARALVGDAEVFPVRGQVVMTENPGISEGISDESDQHRISYVYPRSTTMVLGGTRQLRNADLEPHPEEAERILSDAIHLQPRLIGLPVVDVKVGLRPARAYVRVEKEDVDGLTIVHNYGHGGCGYILSWGCAEEVVTLAGG